MGYLLLIAIGVGVGILISRSSVSQSKPSLNNVNMDDLERKVSNLFSTVNGLISYLSKRDDMKDLRSKLERGISPLSAEIKAKIEPVLPPAPVKEESVDPLGRAVGSFLEKMTVESKGPEKSIEIERKESQPAWKPPQIDWEKFTGVKLFSWIGGFALFLGVAFFVKYSIDRGLLSPMVRVAAGFALGISAIIGGLAIRKKGYLVTVHTLCAAGVAVLYVDIFAAHSFYSFITTGPSFALMSLVTVTAFLLAVRLDSKYVALLGLIGGFLTPPLLATGEDHPFGLFSYIAILDIGLILVALKKKWSFVVSLASIGTVLMMVGWVSKFFTVQKAFTGETISLVFTGLFLATYLFAQRKKEADEWILAPAAIIPIISLLFAGYLLSFPDLGVRPGLVFSFVYVLSLVLAAIAYRDEKFNISYWISGALSFVYLMIWTIKYLTFASLPWGLGFYFAFGVLHGFFPALVKKNHPESTPFIGGNIYPLLMLILIMIPIWSNNVISPIIWPFILFIDAVAIISAVISGVFWVILGVVVLTMGIAGIWLCRVPDLSGLSLILGTMSVFSLGFFALGLFLNKRKAKDKDETTSFIPAMAVVLPFLLLNVVSIQLPLINPAAIFGLSALFIILMLALVRYQNLDVIGVGALVGCGLVEYVWHFYRFETGNFLLAVPWYVGFMMGFLLFPFLFKEHFKDRVTPWIVAAASGPVHFYLIYKAVSSSMGISLIGVLPGIFALVYLTAMLGVKRILDGRESFNSALAIFGGVTLFFISLIFPLQFEKQWITIGWAMEGVALLWLFTRVPHRGLKKWGLGLLLISFVRLALNPAVISYHARTAVPIWNWYLYAYSAVALALFIAAKLWSSHKDDWDKIGEFHVPSVLNSLGGILVFLLLNIEIADYFSEGTTITFQFSGSFAGDMAYSLGWALFAVVVLVLGIYSKSKGARFASLGLLLVTILKLFLHDLWRLGQLYRVGAFMGLAGVLIVVSFLYQRFLAPELTNKKKPELDKGGKIS